MFPGCAPKSRLARLLARHPHPPDQTSFLVKGRIWFSIGREESEAQVRVLLKGWTTTQPSAKNWCQLKCSHKFGVSVCQDGVPKHG